MEKNFAQHDFAKTFNDCLCGAWSNLTQADTAVQLSIPLYNDKTVSVEGTFGTATVTIKGSIDGVNYYTLNDPQGNPLEFTASTKRVEALLENVVYVKPDVQNADGTTDLTINLLAR